MYLHKSQTERRSHFKGLVDGEQCRDILNKPICCFSCRFLTRSALPPVKQRAGVENKYVKPSDLMTFEASPVRWESEKESFWKRRWNILLRRSGEELRSVSKVNNYNILSHFLESGQKKIIAPSLIGNFLCLQSRISHVAFHGVVPYKKKKEREKERKKERKERNKRVLGACIRISDETFCSPSRTANTEQFVGGVWKESLFGRQKKGNFSINFRLHVECYCLKETTWKDS